jgi:hypothetical protein
MVWFIPCYDVVQDYAKTVHIHGVAGCMCTAYQLWGHVSWGASLQQQRKVGIGVLHASFRR